MLLNYTNRALLFVFKDDLINLKNGRYQVESLEQLQRRDYLPVAGPALRVTIDTVIVQVAYGIPVLQERIVDADPIPEGDDILIVSKQYADACRRLCRPTNRLRVVCGGVYTPTLSYPVASTGLAMVEACLPFVMPNLFIDTAGESNVEGALNFIREQRNELQEPLVPIPQIDRDAYLAEQVDAEDQEFSDGSAFPDYKF